MSNYLGYTHYLLGSSKVADHFCDSAICNIHTDCLLDARWSHSKPDAVWVVISWYWHLQNTGVFCCNRTAFSLIVFPGLAS